MTDEYVSVEKLQPHELNDEIYTNKDVSELIEKIDQYGFQETQPLLVTPDDRILSGHRRWRAAKSVGVSEVPIQRVDPDGETDELFTLLLSNQYRDKTPAEKINEADAWERIEREEARERNSESAGASRQKLAETATLADTATGRAKAKAAEKVGASRETVRKGQKIKEKAESGDETAQQEWERMESGEQSIHGAYRKVKQNENALSDPEQDAPAETPQPKALEYEWVNTTTKDVSIQARDCDTTGKYRLYVSGEEYTIEAELYSKLFEKNP